MAGKSVVAVSAVIALIAAASAFAAPGNGGFEKGNLKGWDRTEPGGGTWEVYDDSDGSPSAPAAGEFAARVVQGDPGLNILHRELNAKNGRYLSFHLAYDNTGVGEFVTPKTLKFRREDNQQLRVDLLERDAKIKSLRKGDILKTIFRTKASSPLSSAYEFHFLDLKEEGIKGKFQFRVAEVDNLGEFFVGLDNVFQSNFVP